MYTPQQTQNIEQRSISFPHVKDKKDYQYLSLPATHVDRSQYIKSKEEKNALHKLKTGLNAPIGHTFSNKLN